MLRRLRHLMTHTPLAGHVAPRLPAGERAYVVGDIHGESNLFRSLIEAIEADDVARAGAETTIILLGDLIDRGPDSAGVLALAWELAARRKVRILCGNHEEMFLAALDDDDVLRSFLQYGGRETILSYPIEIKDYNALTVPQLRSRMTKIIPDKDIQFIRTFEDIITLGDYVFVHAGVRPGVALDSQKLKDLRWMREPFLSSADRRDYFVIHGHSITSEVDVRPNRIGIDTGAYVTGRLTAIGLEGDEKWVLTASNIGVTRHHLAAHL